MKKMILLICSSFLMTGCYNRIADLNLVSNRNIGDINQYQIIQRGVEAKAKIKKNQSLEIAIDNAVESVNGEFMQNLEIWLSASGRKIKIKGDVWGKNTDLK